MSAVLSNTEQKMPSYMHASRLVHMLLHASAISNATNSHAICSTAHLDTHASLQKLGHRVGMHVASSLRRRIGVFSQRRNDKDILIITERRMLGLGTEQVAQQETVKAGIANKKAAPLL